MVNEQARYVACIGLTKQTSCIFQDNTGNDLRFFQFGSEKDFYKATEGNKYKFKAIVAESDQTGAYGIHLKAALNKAGYDHIPFITFVDGVHPSNIKEMMKEGIAEVFIKPLSAEAVRRKLDFLINSRSAKGGCSFSTEYKIPIGKRIFDIVIASVILLLFSPVFLIISLLIRLESKGPVFYYSLRVGTGYRIFRFYKFRSMSVGADAKLSSLKHLNQYSTSNEVAGTVIKQRCDTCERTDAACQSRLYADNEMWCEKLYKVHQQTKDQQTFVKIKDDPRVTRVGKFIRNTSIDEFPQLWNVLKGDMSLVGNRPLPLYEAEKLTTDKYALRFMAPAGITGLWQVSKRGKGKMSEDERISLDNDYARCYSLLFDIKLILKTIPALLQKENV